MTTNLVSTARTVLLVVLTTLALGTCSGDSWKEEVLLHDGQKIVVKRSQIYKGQSEIGQSTPIGEHTVSFKLPNSGKSYVWTSEYSEELGRTNFNLLAIHAKNGVPYVVAIPNLCLSYNKWGRPNPPYVVFKHEGDEWRRVALDTLAAEFKTVNTVQYIWGADLAHLVRLGTVSASDVVQLNEQVRQPEMKTILREKVSTACPESFGNGKGFWQGAAWFTDKPNVQACEAYCRELKYDETNCPCKKLFERK